jgi:class 3 adenylate cyclase
MAKPEVRYARSRNVHIAYQAFGEGPVNLVSTPGSISHRDYYWEEPGLRRYMEGLGQFAKVAIFDKRGTGLSDRELGVPTFEERMDDIRAVMDAAQFKDAVLIGMSEGVPMSILFAASYPSRTRGLVLYGGEAKGTWSPDYPWAATKEQWEASFEWDERNWGTKEWVQRAVSFLAPSRLEDEKFTNWLGEMFRMGTSPGASIALGKSDMNMDVRGILPAIHIPTIVIHLTGDKACDVGEGRYIAGRIPGARFVELPGVDHMFFVDSQLTDRILSEIRRFALELEPVTNPDRMLATVLFTDIVDSTRKAAELGDIKWQNVLEQHNSMVSNEILRSRGTLVKNTGDGFLATFDGPTRAIKCAWGVTQSAKNLGIEVRAGVHTGECIIGPTDVSGIAIHTASRVVNEASAGEVLVSSTVRDLVYGSGISFKERGEYLLKGIEEKRRLYSVESVP